ncbi:MAG: hypothetical protein JNL63_00710 [Bacteroidia bacterium]|nr:hypothetical protein [Bacteroidia bacterium]
MKKFFIIALLSVYFVSITELNQLTKLPLLVQHFAEHKGKDNDISLWQFLAMHYTQSDDHDGDREKDMKLPFKSHESCVNAGTLAFIPSGFENPSTKLIDIPNKAWSIYIEQFLSAAYLSSIWQPPKSA